MQNTIILIAPSESKLSGGTKAKEKLTFQLAKPLTVAQQATPKDLKCKDKRYEQAIQLNKTVEEGPWESAILRYTGTQFKELGYSTLTPGQQQRINTHVIICSGMYGLLSPQDQIAEYKIPIGAKGLVGYRKKTITETIKEQAPAHIINLLPGSYAKMIDRKHISCPVTSIEFIQSGKHQKKITHQTKKYRGQRLRKIAQNSGELPSDKNSHIHQVIIKE